MSWNLFRGQPTGPIALVTAMFGGIDDLKPLPEHPGIDAFYYTDDAGRSAASSPAAATWTRVIVPDYPRHDFNPRLRGRYFKHVISPRGRPAPNHFQGLRARGGQASEKSSDSSVRFGL